MTFSNDWQLAPGKAAQVQEQITPFYYFPESEVSHSTLQAGTEMDLLTALVCPCEKHLAANES